MPLIPVSWGEVFDKVTILRIKALRLQDPVKRVNVEAELEALSKVIGDVSRFPAEVNSLIESLHIINAKLWDIEEGKRRAEKEKLFDDNFVSLARAVYIENDERARLKKAINILLGSTIVEEKSY